jgi:hypothetical protein
VWRVKQDDPVEVIIDASWFKKFSWSRQLIDPDLGLPPTAPALAITGVLQQLDHPQALRIRTGYTWDRSGRQHAGIELVIPWGYVIAVLELREPETAMKRLGFLEAKDAKG